MNVTLADKNARSHFKQIFLFFVKKKIIGYFYTVKTN